MEAPGCWTQWNWSNGGTWSVKVLVIDEELDTDEVLIDVVVLNRAPTFNLSYPASVPVESPVTIQVSNMSDIDSVSAPGQILKIYWPSWTGCDIVGDSQGSEKTCTFTPTEEGLLSVVAEGRDDDGETTNITAEIMVLNIPPTVSAPTLMKGGEEVLPDENGTWHLNEDEVALLKATATDSANDAGTMLIEWHPSLADENWTVSTVGVASSQPMSWNTSGMHTVQVRAIDGDGASSEAKQGTLMVHNVPPTVTGLIPYEAVIEDNPLELTVVPDDTPSDMETLEVCWDLDAKFDADNDGEADNDCEKTGASIVASWPTSPFEW